MTDLVDTSLRIRKLNALKDSLGCAASGLKYHVRTLVLDSALTDADTAQTISIADDDDGNAFPANARPIAAYAIPIGPIAGTAVDTLTIAIGDAGNTDELLEETDLVALDPQDWIDAPGAYTAWSLEASAYVPVADFVATGGGNVAAATGTVVCVVVYWKLGNPFVSGAKAGGVLVGQSS
jgi:hypothetical protein